MVAFECLGRVFLAAHGRGDASPEQWQRIIDALEENAETVEVLLVTSHGGPLTPVQRAQISHVIRSQGLEVMMATDSPLVRGAVTAVRWLGVPIQACSVDEREHALEDFCGLCGVELEMAKQTIRELDQIVLGAGSGTFPVNGTPAERASGDD